MLFCEIFLRTIILKNMCEGLFLNFVLKETPIQMFSCEFCELFKNTYFVEDLQTAGYETLVRGSLFNKVSSLTAWRPLTVLERDCSTVISLWILWNLLGSLFCRTPPSNDFSHDVVCFLLLADKWGFQSKINLFGGAMLN